ncbi:hypothetical protein BDZ85DRAFT_302361 [Elsinoe ampelina]|uniref:Uncharacterized protein n=1 Tax=Elsinoe ampelina TaxID=302913 RepID=A0A6A6G5W1_9PEZI|nr:hypothetical protein BDZ85DRAFT_302361 [Elsinoe ampelina]
MASARRSRGGCEVGIICAIGTEEVAVLAMVDERHPQIQTPATDQIAYGYGTICSINIVIACLPVDDAMLSTQSAPFGAWPLTPDELHAALVCETLCVRGDDIRECFHGNDGRESCQGLIEMLSDNDDIGSGAELPDIVLSQSVSDDNLYIFDQEVQDRTSSLVPELRPLMLVLFCDSGFKANTSFKPNVMVT